MTFHGAGGDAYCRRDFFADLSGGEQRDLIGYYKQKQAENGRVVDDEFDQILHLCAMQRLMQALGAYGFLGLAKGHKTFLDFIPAATRSLRSVLSTVDGLEPIAALLAQLS